MQKRLLVNLNVALNAIITNRTRALLTGLGMVFGVAAVIAMLAIGRGAQEEVLDQIKLVGVNNLVITPKIETEPKEEDTKQQGLPKRFSRGLSIKDLEAIKQTVPHIAHISPEIIQDITAMQGGKSMKSRLVGVHNSFFEVMPLMLQSGSKFSEKQQQAGMPVCIIGSAIRRKLFPSGQSVGQLIKCGNQWLRVIGVMEEKNISDKAQENLGIRNYNQDIFIPLNTALFRFRSNQANINNSSTIMSGNMVIFSDDEGESNAKPKEKSQHQISRITIQAKKGEDLPAIAEIINRMLLRLHNQVPDFEISIPEQLLKQQQRTKDIFNMVLGAIAGISLVVGGIGIMNIMLASVLERTREIGIRQALGARRSDVIAQFVFEAVFISLSGGVIGILLGIFLAYFIESITEIKTIISYYAIFLSFGVATLVGLIFGISPAKKAASQNPVESLRYE